MDLRTGVVGDFTGIPFSSKEELISLIMDTCNCQRSMALKAIDSMLIWSIEEGYITEEFFREYWSGDRKCNI